MLPLAVLAGGFAVRLGELTKEIPKCLVEINGKPFVNWQIELLSAAGFTDFIFCTSYKSNLVQEYLGDGSKWNVSIRYSLDGTEQLGTGGAIRNALPILGEKFAVIYGDSYLPTNYFEVEDHFLRTSSLAMMTVFENNNLLDNSNVEFSNEKILNYSKNSNNSKMRHIDYGLTYFNSRSFENYRPGSKFDLAELCSNLASMGKLDGHLVHERFYEVGSFSGITDLSDYLGKAN